MDKILAYIPGFRTGTPRHMVLAGAYYLFALSMMLVSVALGILLLSGPFLLFQGYAAMVKYNETKNARALIALFLSAAICGGSLIGFVADMTGRQERIPIEPALLMDTATPHTAPVGSPVSESEPTVSPSPTGPPLERAIVLGYAKSGINVQYADETTGAIRLAGIEIEEDILDRASDYLSQILPPGSIVDIEEDPNGEYYVWTDTPHLFDTDEVRRNTLNALLVLNGYASVSGNTKGMYAEVLSACEEAARAACAGLWAVALETAAAMTPPTPAITPTPAPTPPQDIAPTPAPVPEAPPVKPPPGGAYFCGSKQSDVFHLSTCGSASQISPENLVTYSSREDAINQGKRPCKKCNP